MSHQTPTEFDQDTAPEPMPRQQQAAPVQPQYAEPPVQDVPFQQAIAEEQGASYTQQPPFESAAMSDESMGPEPGFEKEDVVDILEPKAAPREWRFGPNDMPLVYVQRPLSFIAKMQWFALVGEVLDKAMSGDNPVSINSLLDTPGRPGGGLTLADFRDADTFVRALGKLVVNAPTFITDSYCIWLGVPTVQRGLVSEIMALPESEGGLSDEQGLEIIEVFIDQNYDALADFFGDKVSKLQRRVQARQESRKGRARARG